MKTSELIGPALDWAVAKCEELEIVENSCLYSVAVWKCCPLTKDKEVIIDFKPSTDWAQGGPIIEREKMDFKWVGGHHMPSENRQLFHKMLRYRTHSFDRSHEVLRRQQARRRG